VNAAALLERSRALATNSGGRGVQGPGESGKMLRGPVTSGCVVPDPGDRWGRSGVLATKAGKNAWHSSLYHSTVLNAK